MTEVVPAGARLPPLTLEEARRLQFRLIETLRRHFTGHEWLTRGELGVGSDGEGSPFTRRVEQVLAAFFGSEAAVLVTGAGTGAIRAALFALLPPLSRIVVHDAPLYATTAVTFRAAGYVALPVDLHDLGRLRQVLSHEEVQAVYVQHTRQQLSDHYDLAAVITCVRGIRPELPIIVDDNYAVANTPRIGVELGADVSAFSAYKLLGPEGVGVVLCPQRLAQAIRADMYSGGSRVQGFQAQEVVIGLAQAFVANALTQASAEAVVERLCNAPPPACARHIAGAFLANLQSPVVLVRLRQPLARLVVARAAEHGAAPFPVGAMARYELLPLFYRVSGTMSASLGTEEAQHWLRINPMRAGPETVLAILEEALSEV
ncbi:aminotransferase class V-fold PLP-dependent enzyme [Thermogemmatispora sp.]|uniref:aminotransferase class V-fold PLP-dependent enzyme n=1 Tax=Thermogemmatispora sp. TaxID=1968838 RepID=UPI001D9D32EC|nr:aminotransferase class V-fold PLP-dependent enzyme [Thermogemmatispora sp.]MBX5450348.1 aminotransferase class V-fold PLP-dependent enzyme [Thermogemmatispora sp.]